MGSNRRDQIGDGIKLVTGAKRPGANDWDQIGNGIKLVIGAKMPGAKITGEQIGLEQIGRDQKSFGIKFAGSNRPKRPRDQIGGIKLGDNQI